MPSLTLPNKTLEDLLKSAPKSENNKALTFENALKLSQNGLFLLNSYDIHLYEAVLSEGLKNITEARNWVVKEQKALLATAPTCQYTSSTPEGQQYDELMNRYDLLCLQSTIAKQKLTIIEEVKQVDTALKLTKDEAASSHKYHLGIHKRILGKYLSSLIHYAHTPYQDHTNNSSIIQSFKQKIEQVEKQISLFTQFAIHPAI